MSGHCATDDKDIKDVTIKMIDSFINNNMNEKLGLMAASKGAHSNAVFGSWMKCTDGKDTGILIMMDSACALVEVKCV